MNSKTGNTIIHFLLNSISFPVFFEVKSGENSCMHISDIFQKIDLKLWTSIELGFFPVDSLG